MSSFYLFCQEETDGSDRRGGSKVPAASDADETRCLVRKGGRGGVGGITTFVSSLLSVCYIL